MSRKESISRDIPLSNRFRRLSWLRPFVPNISPWRSLVALICWGVYSFEAFAARRMGWGGRRTAYLSALGFAIVLLNLVPISFLTPSHNF